MIGKIFLCGKDDSNIFQITDLNQLERITKKSGNADIYIPEKSHLFKELVKLSNKYRLNKHVVKGKENFNSENCPSIKLFYDNYFKKLEEDLTIICQDKELADFYGELINTNE